MPKILKSFTQFMTRTFQRFWGITSTSAFFADIASLVQLFSAWRRNRYRDISFPTSVTMVVSLMYVIFPFDLLPDIIPLLGWIDDIAVLKLVTDSLRYEINKFRVWQRWIEETARENSSSHT